MDYRQLGHSGVRVSIIGLGANRFGSSDVPQAEVDEERSIQRAKTLNEGKKEAVVDKIVDGRMEKWFEEIVLLDQLWLHDDKLKVSEVLTDLIGSIKENIVIRRFARFALGEAGPAESPAE